MEEPTGPAEDLTAVIKLRRAAQITLPTEIRKAARLKEGDYMEAEITENGSILLKPVTISRREPTEEQAAEILAVVDETRSSYAKERNESRH